MMVSVKIFNRLADDLDDADADDADADDGDADADDAGDRQDFHLSCWRGWHFPPAPSGRPSISSPPSFRSYIIGHLNLARDAQDYWWSQEGVILFVTSWLP